MSRLASPLFLLSAVCLLCGSVLGVTFDNSTEIDEPWNSPYPKFNGTAACERYAAGRFTITLTSSKRFILFVPQGMPTPPTPRPLLFNFHGYTNDPANQYSRSKMEPAAAKFQFYTITPEGSGISRGWNAGGCCPLVTRDDVLFTREMHQWAVNNLCIDVDKVFSTGFSNGGFMSHRLACQANDIISGIAPHSGVLAYGNSFSSCVARRPVALVAFHGTSDSTVPYNGGSWPSFQTTFNHWRDFNSCPGTHTTVRKTLNSYCWEFTNCRKDGKTVPTIFCTIDLLPHRWSGGNEGSGTNPNDIDATEYMWEIFSKL